MAKQEKVTGCRAAPGKLPRSTYRINYQPNVAVAVAVAVAFEVAVDPPRHMTLPHLRSPFFGEAHIKKIQ
ncbi:hypothetical protein ACVBEF_19770 [Glaciimonas sp. GG7]